MHYYQIVKMIPFVVSEVYNLGLTYKRPEFFAPLSA